MDRKKLDNEIIELENGFTRKQSRVSKFITEARSNLNLNELKTFYQLTTLINMEDKDFNHYEIGIKEFVDTLELHNKDRAYIKKICKNLLEQNFILDYTHENNDWDLVKISIFKQFSYKHKEQKLLISFSEDIKPYLLELKERFTKIENVEYIKQFDSKYAIRIYALLKDYRKMTYRDIEIEALHKMLQLPKSYLDYGQFKKRVLDPALVEINEKSDLYISKIEEIKKQRKKVLRIRIYFENKATKIAEDKIKYLLKFYKDNKEAFGYKAFLGFKYEQDGVIRTITKIHQEKENNYHAIYCDHSDSISYSCHDGKTFLNRLCNGIHNAIEIEAEQEKQARLDLIDWQDEQERINAYKEIMRKWIEKRQKESVRV